MRADCKDSEFLLLGVRVWLSVTNAKVFIDHYSVFLSVWSYLTALPGGQGAHEYQVHNLAGHGGYFPFKCSHWYLHNKPGSPGLGELQAAEM